MTSPLGEMTKSSMEAFPLTTASLTFPKASMFTSVGEDLLRSPPRTSPAEVTAAPTERLNENRSFSFFAVLVFTKVTVTGVVAPSRT